MPAKPIPYAVGAKKADVLVPLEPSDVKLTGWLGERVTKNEANRLREVDLAPLLAGYQKRPGSHPWIGEHIGKWMHASTLAWQNTNDAALKAKLDGAVKALIVCQEPDGYLGTYEKEMRFKLIPQRDWDVWSHKYNLIGLLTYYHYTGDKPALECCRKMGDLLCHTFGTGPGQRSINSAGTHMGMAATSVLEPMVLLYRSTNDKKYLDFCQYIVRAWDEPGGPGVLTTLTRTGKVNKTANGKAYEMLSNLVGLCELYRATGDTRFLTPCQNAFSDIVENQLYVTGAMSYGEHFHDDHTLPNTPGYNIGETCVTVTWIQLCLQLLRLTGDQKYATELERSYYNHLAAAQRPDGKEWCYYTALEGTKPYGPGINCCVSSGPRGMALAPLTACFVGDGGKAVVVTSRDSFEATVMVQGVPVKVTQTSPLPGGGVIETRFEAARPTMFTARVGGANTRINSKGMVSRPLKMDREVVEGAYSNKGKTVAKRGLFVLAEQAGKEILFAEAGAKGERYRIWVGPASENAEDRIRPGNIEGSINDGDVRTFVVSWDGNSHDDDDWYSITLAKPKRVSKLSYAHGHSFHDGGWFVGAPRFEVRTTPDGLWENVGTLPDYPATTDTSPKGLKDGQWFVLTLPAPKEIIAVRIIGKPSCGDDPNMRFTSCAELKVE
ncbi:MAG: glycoside hydrolase family 127 protein [Armatimonas sp.]